MFYSSSPLFAFVIFTRIQPREAPGSKPKACCNCSNHLGDMTEQRCCTSAADTLDRAAAPDRAVRIRSSVGCDTSAYCAARRCRRPFSNSSVGYSAHHRRRTRVPQQPTTDDAATAARSPVRLGQQPPSTAVGPFRFSARAHAVPPPLPPPLPLPPPPLPLLSETSTTPFHEDGQCHHQKC